MYNTYKMFTGLLLPGAVAGRRLPAPEPLLLRGGRGRAPAVPETRARAGRLLPERAGHPPDGRGGQRRPSHGLGPSGLHGRTLRQTLALHSLVAGAVLS